MNKSKNYTLKVIKKHEKVEGIRTHSIRLFIKHLRTINWENNPLIYLRVSYGKHMAHGGNIVTFYNDGFFSDKKELEETFKAFNDEE